MDTYLEFIIKQKYTFGKIICIIFLYTLATILSLGVFLIAITSPAVMQLSGFIIALLFFGVWTLHKKFNVEYEYILTNDELDVDRISAKRSRKRLLTVSVRNFDEFGTADDNSILKRKKDFKVVLDASIGKGSINRYYATFNNKHGDRMLLIFNPTSKMIDAFKIYNPKVIW